MSSETKTQRYAACIEYRGTHYSGWQRQSHTNTVQHHVEVALAKIANHPVSVIVAGRTDTGVHGIGQVIHFDSSSQREEYNWIRGVNTELPDDISLAWIKSVPNDFHARFVAKERSYRYVILNRKVSPSYLDGLVTWRHSALNVILMQQAAQTLLGKHDFSAFRAAGCQSKNPVKELKQLEVSSKDRWIWVDVTADGFLYHMVRNIVGVLCEIGENEQPVSWARDVLEGRDRTKGGITTPPDGLYFVKVAYDSGYALPEPPSVCRFW